MSHEKTRLKKAELKIRDEDIKETADPLLSLKLTCPKALSMLIIWRVLLGVRGRLFNKSIKKTY